ncbi:MAG TPA: efflux RND transporter periplasmic adaptor subunit [Dyella sp.]|uniref:HlyD family secretion protein n=1 Tax=Dyella sp. TaxID=1869338 RepID=UPI002BABF33E|nr:efflux RND transporter periplasmic adaptor subunit [Dyella sp.]HUB90365.1 efflux RND transporter periplasmic adaptor subunit [Dyella sp.]
MDHRYRISKRTITVSAIALALAGVSYWALRSGMFVRWFGHAPSSTLVLSGNIEAHESVLSFKSVQSRIVALPFDEGQWVKKGTLIARVDDSDYRQQVAIAQANVVSQERALAAAGSNLAAAQKVLGADEADLRYKTLNDSRMQQLSVKGYVSLDSRDLADAAVRESHAALQRDRALEKAAEGNLQLAAANVADAKEALKLAQITESYTTLVAPIDGVILVRQAELGEVVIPGTPVVTIADLDHVWLRAYINEPDVGRVRFGQAADVTTDNFPGRVYPGRVSFISEQAEFTPKSVETHAERVTLVYRTRIDIANPKHELVPGMPADVSFHFSP